MNRYKISPYVQIQPIEQSGIENIPAGILHDHYALYHEAKNRDYLINGTIKFFLDKFIIPHTIDEVISSIKNELNTDSNEVENICNEFFEFLLSRRILVNEGANLVTISKEVYFKDGDKVNGLIVHSLLSCRNLLELYKAYDPESGIFSVMKVLTRTKARNDTEFKNESGWLEREFILLNRMNHVPAMCKAFAFEQNETMAYIQLEYIEGKSLNSYLKEVGRLSLSDSLLLLKRLLNPFADLHDSQLVHGDIHSSNILINNNMNVRVIDLGFSSIAELENDELLKSGGVTFYMPPERINLTSIRKYKSLAANLRSDVYQLGMLMFLTIYRILPFSGFIWEELAANIQTAEINFAGGSFSGYTVPENLISIMRKCLERNPGDRYANAGLILNEFNAHFYPKKESALN